MTATRSEPSKGALRAGREILSRFGKRVHDDHWQRSCAEVIDRETKAGEMEKLLRRIVAHPNFAGCIDPLGSSGIDLRARAERLLSELEGR